MNRLVHCIVAATIGGLAGAAIWAAITYFTGYEVGWIAWGIGALVGAAVRMAAGEETGAALGIVAVLASILAIVGGKYTAVYFLVEKAFQEGEAELTITADLMQEVLAGEIVEEWQAVGRELTWPEVSDPEEAPASDRYPNDVWQEAQQRWAALSSDEQQKRVDEHTLKMREFTGLMRDAIAKEGFKDSFSPIDIIFFALAVFTAFRLGSGATGE